MAWDTSPFHRFRGWHILVLAFVTLSYGYWFAALGPYVKLSTLGPEFPLQAKGFYTGVEAVSALSSLDAAGQKAKYIALAFDIPFMILTALLFEALIAFGIRRLNLIKPVWNFLFILPIAFLLADFTEDSLLALTLSTGSELIGSLAGLATAFKFLVYVPANIVALGMGAAGLLVWVLRGRR
jgi:hypothetical protein